MIPVSVSLQSVTRLHRANTAERIEVLFEVETLGAYGNLRNIVLDGALYFSHKFDAVFAKLIWPRTCSFATAASHHDIIIIIIIIITIIITKSIPEQKIHNTIKTVH